MILWTVWKTFFGFLCLFRKLFSDLTHKTVEKAKNDPESPNHSDKRRCHSKQESVHLDSHYLATERQGKQSGIPDTRQECFRSDATHDTVLKRDRSRPVHEAIEFFDKPNDIETSLPRYQNKISRVSKNRSADECKRQTMPVKLIKLREQLEQKLAARLEKCKSERNIRTRSSNAYKSDEAMLSKLHKYEKDGSDCAGREKSETDRKSEKEKHNSLIKVNLTQMSKCEVVSDNTFKGKVPQKLTRLAEEQYLKKLGKNCEYGGGWECHRCGKRVYHAEKMLACGNAYHRHCFSCVTCKKLLGPRTYLEAEMEIYCSQCHAKAFGLTGYGYGLGAGVLQTSP